MGLFDIFKKPPPPPKPWYKNITLIAVILTAVSIFVLAPVGAIYNGMSEEIKKLDDEKASKETIQQMLKNQETLIKQNKEDGERMNKAIEKNQEAIQQLLRVPNLRIVENPDTNEEQKENNTSKNLNRLTPEQFEKYMSMDPVTRQKYKKYLEHTGCDTSGLPD